MWDEWQKDFLRCKGDKILCCGRQVGKSEICSADAGEWAAKNAGDKNVVIIAPTERQAYGLFTKTLNYLATHYSNLLITTGKHRPTKTRISLKNGVKIFCLPVGKEGLGIRFLTIHRLYVDEASRVPEGVWAAIEPALLTTGGEMILLSTPFGAVGEFYNVWVNKDGAYESFTRFSVTSEVVMRERKICATWTEKTRSKALIKLEQAKKRKSKREYAQEYLGEFVEDLHRYFNDELIAKCCILQRRTRLLQDKQYYMGCDIARMGEDEGTYEILDKRDRENLIHVENIVTSKKRTNETEDLIIELNKRYEFKKIFIDAGSGTLGVSILDHLLIHPETKRVVEAINNNKRMVDREGSKTKLLKTDLYDNLRSLMEKGSIQLLDDEEVMQSFRSVQYEYIMKDGEPTRLRIFGDYTHIVEGLIRAAWCVQYKNLNTWMRSFSV